jgi:hypothetical protein
MVQVAVPPAGTNAGAQFSALMITCPLGGGPLGGGLLGGGLLDEPVNAIEAVCEEPL